jgi:hypothetical protein
MKSLIVKSLEIVLFITFFLIVISMGISMPIIGIIPGIIIGALVTGTGFVLLSINDNLTEIRKTLQAQSSQPKNLD